MNLLDVFVIGFVLLVIELQSLNELCWQQYSLEILAHRVYVSCTQIDCKQKRFISFSCNFFGAQFFFFLKENNMYLQNILL